MALWGGVGLDLIYHTWVKITLTTPRTALFAVIIDTIMEKITAGAINSFHPGHCLHGV